MCFMALGAIGGLMGSAVSAMGAQAQANSSAAQMDYNSQVAKINARTARQQGVAQTETIYRKYDKQGGQMTAALAKAGVNPGTGSAALVLAENDRNSWLDANNAIWNRETEAIGNENKARDLEAQAENTRSAGKGSFLTALVGGGTKFLGSGAGSTLMINEA